MFGFADAIETVPFSGVRTPRRGNKTHLRKPQAALKGQSRSVSEPQQFSVHRTGHTIVLLWNPPSDLDSDTVKCRVSQHRAKIYIRSINVLCFKKNCNALQKMFQISHVQQKALLIRINPLILHSKNLRRAIQFRTLNPPCHSAFGACGWSFALQK